MASISRVTTWNSGDTLTASALNGEFNNILNDYNGNITNANIASGAAISLSKLASTPATLTGSETLTNKTHTSPVLNGTLSGTAFLDEDTMTSDSATKAASQQSIKAYVDSKFTYTTWSPTLANITQGDGVVVARYVQNGKFVHGYFIFSLGTTSAMGTAPTFTVPVAAHASYAARKGGAIGETRFWDNSASAMYPGMAQLKESATVVDIRAIDTTTTYGANGTVGSGVPFTWATSDELVVEFSYEAA